MGLPQTPEFIKLERKGPVLYVWLNKPETRNALVGAMRVSGLFSHT